MTLPARSLQRSSHQVDLASARLHAVCHVRCPAARVCPCNTAVTAFGAPCACTMLSKELTTISPVLRDRVRGVILLTVALRPSRRLTQRQRRGGRRRQR